MSMTINADMYNSNVHILFQHSLIHLHSSIIIYQLILLHLYCFSSRHHCLFSSKFASSPMDPVSTFLDFCFDSNWRNIAKKKTVTYNDLDTLFSHYDSWPSCDCSVRECFAAYCKAICSGTIENFHVGNIKRKTANMIKQGRGGDNVKELHRAALAELGPHCTKHGIVEGDVQAAMCDEYGRERMGWECLTNGVVLELHAWGRKRGLSTSHVKHLVSVLFDVDFDGVSDRRLNNKIVNLRNKKNDTLKSKGNEAKKLMNEVFVIMSIVVDGRQKGGTCKTSKKRKQRGARVRRRVRERVSKSTQQSRCTCRLRKQRELHHKNINAKLTQQRKKMLTRLKHFEQKLHDYKLKLADAIVQNNHMKRKDARRMKSLESRKKSLKNMHIELLTHKLKISQLEAEIKQLKKVETIKHEKKKAMKAKWQKKQTREKYLKKRNEMLTRTMRENRSLKNRLKKLVTNIKQS